MTNQGYINHLTTEPHVKTSTKLPPIQAIGVPIIEFVPREQQGLGTGKGKCEKFKHKLKKHFQEGNMSVTLSSSNHVLCKERNIAILRLVIIKQVT